MVRCQTNRQRAEQRDVQRRHRQWSRLTADMWRRDDDEHEQACSLASLLALASYRFHSMSDGSPLPVDNSNNKQIDKWKKYDIKGFDKLLERMELRATTTLDSAWRWLATMLVSPMVRGVATLWCWSAWMWTMSMKSMNARCYCHRSAYDTTAKHYRHVTTPPISIQYLEQQNYPLHHHRERKEKKKNEKKKWFKEKTKKILFPKPATTGSNQTEIFDIPLLFSQWAIVTPETAFSLKDTEESKTHKNVKNIHRIISTKKNVSRFSKQVAITIFLQIL